jgi:hypothetical protein
METAFPESCSKKGIEELHSECENVQNSTGRIGITSY